ncbi:MAG: RsmE family RNA methyltransferase [Anaerolineae bacterium]
MEHEHTNLFGCPLPRRGGERRGGLLRVQGRGDQFLDPCVRLFVGPEGGFDQGESKLLQEAGAIPVTLGARTLRTETAGLAMLAVVGYALGEMG